jgi:hypothetical protein
MRRLQLLVSAAMICFPGAEAPQVEEFNGACTSAPRHLWLSLQALETKVESQGYKIQRGRLTSTCAAFEAINEDGARVELFVNPTNGEIIGRIKLQQAAKTTSADGASVTS